MKRRSFLKGAITGIGLAALPALAKANSVSTMGHVVIIGAGFGGATAAKYLRLWSQGRVEVTLIEPRSQFISCPVSNRLFAGTTSIDDITHSYDALSTHYGVRLIKGTALKIDPESRTVETNMNKIRYDRLIVATGIDFDYSTLPMLNAEIQASSIPHAWKAGAQTVLLKNQLEAMPDGGVVGITIPLIPFRCPPGPYERACQIGYYLKQRKPKSKLLIMDANPAIVSKRPLFERAFHELYPGIVEYLPGNVINNLDVKSKTLTTTFDQFKLDVLNLIPPQSAGRMCMENGLASSSKPWCEVNFLNYESQNITGTHVLGDSVASFLPKSAHIATSQAKVCANAIIAELSGTEVDQAPVFANTCYSFVDDKEAVHVANVYRYDSKDKEMRAASGGGISASPSLIEGQQADTWAQNIWADVLN